MTNNKFSLRFGFSILVLFFTACGTSTKVPLFDGLTLDGWRGSEVAFHVEDGSIIGGNLKKPLDESYYLCTERKYGDFDLTVSVKFNDEKSIGNGGISFRANRVPNSTEVAGYQADMGNIAPKYISRFSDYTPNDMEAPFSLWGILVDENRSDTSRYPDANFFPVVFLSIPERKLINKIIKPDSWNEIRVIADGNEIEIRVNDVTTAKFTENIDVPKEGCICLQAHSGQPFEVLYKDIKIRPKN